MSPSGQPAPLSPLSSPSTPSTPSALLQAAVRADPTRPLMTFYDDGTGERTELSVATFDNWVAKTANLLQDGLALEPGARVQVRLPVHWQAAVWLSACWAAGMIVVPAPQAADKPGTAAQDDRGDVDVLVAALDDLRHRPAPVGVDTVALALRPLGMPGSDVPAGVLDYDVEIRAYADRFAPVAPVPPTAPALETDGDRFTAQMLATAATAQAATWQLSRTDRVLVSASLLTPAGVLAGLLAPLAADASVVLCRRLAPATLPARLASERVTAVVRPVVSDDEREPEADIQALQQQGLVSADLRTL